MISSPMTNDHFTPVSLERQVRSLVTRYDIQLKIPIDLTSKIMLPYKEPGLQVTYAGVSHAECRHCMFVS